MKSFGRYVVLAAGLLLSACAADSTTADTTNDPYEKTNRAVFDFNQKVDQNIALPVAKAYVAVTPDDLRTVVHNFLVNLDLPITFANDILQGEVSRAGETLGRFTVNSTIGFGGLLDPATDVGIPNHTEDFGITLGKWGVGEGPYIVLPLIGPDPPRDVAGQVVDIFFDPSTYISLRDHFYYSAGRDVLYVLDLRSRNIGTLESIERSSIDYYASVRSLYRQRRNNDINNGAPDVNNLPNL